MAHTPIKNTIYKKIKKTNNHIKTKTIIITNKNIQTTKTTKYKLTNNQQNEN